MTRHGTDGVLSVVATPIGNLEDITVRALRTLTECDYVLCEDTRVTGKLLAHYEIKKPLKRYDAHVSAHAHAQFIADLEAGLHLALVSDAGTPGVSDPGVLLVAQVRQRGIRIEAIPGASALTTAISIAGIAGNQFTFLGFVPHKKGRETFVRELMSHIQPVLFFESTHRIMKLLVQLEAVYPDARLSLAREQTKLHEEFIQGTPTELRLLLEATPVKQKGEFVVLFESHEYV